MATVHSLPGDLVALLGRFPYWGFLLGLVGAFLVTWVRDRQTESRLRRATREALASEAIDNLEILDIYERILTQTAAGESNTWPGDEIRTFVKEYSLNPEIAATLTEDEQARILLSMNHIRILAGRMGRGYELGNRLGSFQGPALKVLGKHTIAYTGQNLIDLLIPLLLEQGEFVSTETQDLAGRLVPALRGKGRPLNRLWKTSLISKSNPPDNLLIVWQNDRPDLISEGTEVIELRPDPTKGNRTVDRTGWWTTLVEPVRRARQRRRILLGVERARDSQTIGDDHPSDDA